jgi:hypothetical protein
MTLPRPLTVDDTPDNLSLMKALMDSLSEKLARHLSPERWNRVFDEGDAASIRFEQRQLSILYAEVPGNGLDDECARESFHVDLDRLATRHEGCIDPFGEAAGVVFFADPASCVRMAMDLQRGSRNLHLRIGVHTGPCDIGTFRSSGDWNCTLVGDEPRQAAKVAATAAIGSIAISPATYGLVKHVIEADASGCLLMEEFRDSDLEQVSLTPTPVRRGEHGLSTFAGLGR